MKSPTESFTFDPWPTFLLKDCLVKTALSENAIVTPIMMKFSLPHYGLKNYCPVSGLRFDVQTCGVDGDLSVE